MAYLVYFVPLVKPFFNIQRELMSRGPLHIYEVFEKHIPEQQLNQIIQIPEKKQDISQ